jgi:hypothetical protein
MPEHEKGAKGVFTTCDTAQADPGDRSFSSRERCAHQRCLVAGSSLNHLLPGKSDTVEIPVLDPADERLPFVSSQCDGRTILIRYATDQYVFALCCDLDPRATVAPLSSAPGRLAC